VTNIQVKQLLKQDKVLVGFDFVYRKLIGWLWFAIGLSLVSDRFVLAPVNGSSEKRCNCKREGKLC